VTNRVTLIHWNAGEAGERAERLRRAGYEVSYFGADRGPAGYRALRDDPPDTFVIDLSRMPSHGRAVGVFLRQQKGTRHVPIVFAGGEPEKVARVREQLPDAVYTAWSRIRDAVGRAIRQPPKDPHVPGTMDAYSATPLPEKLGVRAGARIALLGAPAGFERKLAGVLKDIRIRKQARGRADVILLFVKSRAELERRLPAAKRALLDAGALWIAWPKKASGVATDLTQKSVRKVALDVGLVDYKIAAIDQTWSGLRFARRRAV